MFTAEERDAVRDRLLALARDDPRIAAAAEIGSVAAGAADRWSDVDLTFGVATGADVDAVIADWTSRLSIELSAVHLFDLSSGPLTYRVFLLPGTLQVDLSFAAASAFAPRHPFNLAFGEAKEPPASSPPSIAHLFGLGAHHAVRARVCIERGRLWEAEHWVSGVRDQALALACARSGRATSHGRGFDELPAGLLRGAERALVASLDRDELLRAFGHAIELLAAQGEGVPAARLLRDELLGLARPVLE